MMSLHIYTFVVGGGVSREKLGWSGPTRVHGEHAPAWILGRICLHTFCHERARTQRRAVARLWRKCCQATKAIAGVASRGLAVRCSFYRSRLTAATHALSDTGSQAATIDTMTPWFAVGWGGAGAWGYRQATAKPRGWICSL